MLLAKPCHLSKGYGADDGGEGPSKSQVMTTGSHGFKFILQLVMTHMHFGAPHWASVENAALPPRNRVAQPDPPIHTIHTKAFGSKICVVVSFLHCRVRKALN